MFKATYALNIIFNKERGFQYTKFCSKNSFQGALARSTYLGQENIL